MRKFIWVGWEVDTMPQQNEPKRNKSVRRMFTIVEALMDLDGGTLSELADMTDIAPSTIYRYLQTLKEEGYIDEDEGTYFVGIRFLDLGGHACNRLEGFRIIEPKINELAEETQKRVQYLVEDRGEIVYVCRRTGSTGFNVGSRIGSRLPVNATAGGKAILAHLPSSEVDEILASRPLESYTQNTVTDEDEYREELDAVRERGHSYNDEEFKPGLRTVGVPVFHPDQSVIGALTVSAPSHQLRDEDFHETLPEKLKGVANEIQLEIAY